ncbi:MAG: DUF4349 domain-containing protein [Saprospiraceae bacterium]|nr:DUF4349 domain-containing protein [Saprospiraceae bacterium]
MSKIGITLLSCLLITSCQNQYSESDSTMGKYQNHEGALQLDDEIEIEPPRTNEPPPPPEFILEKGSKIIKNGYAKFEVHKLDVAKKEVDTILRRYSGYYENEQYNSYGNRVSYSLLIRIPSAKFDTLINTVEQGLGKLISKNITAKDVTEEYVDLNIRLDNNLAYLNQYKEILGKAKSVKEIIEVQEKIRRIEEEIESKKGRIKYLDDKVKYSTLTLEITELITTEISETPRFGRRLINAFNNGVQSFLSFIVGLVNLWPYLILFVLLFLVRKPILNKIRRKNTPPHKG